MKNTDKITISVGQLKRLIKESKRKIDVWYVWTGDLDTDDSLYEIVDSCAEDNSNYKQCHGNVLKWLQDNVGAEFGPKDAKHVTKHFIGLRVDPNDWPPSLMFEDEKSAELVAHTLAQGTHLWPEDLYAKNYYNDSEIEESKPLLEYEISDDGYDDEGNYVGEYGKYDWERRHGRIWSDVDDIDYPGGRHPSKIKRDLPGYGDEETWGERKP